MTQVRQTCVAFEGAARGTIADALPTSSQPQTTAISVSPTATFGISTPPRLLVAHNALRRREVGAAVVFGASGLTGAVSGSLCQSPRAKGPPLLIDHRCCAPVVISERWSPGEEEHSTGAIADAQGVSAATASCPSSEKTIVSEPRSEAHSAGVQRPGLPARGRPRGRPLAVARGCRTGSAGGRNGECNARISPATG